MIAEGLVTFCIALLSPKKELPTSLKDSPPAKKNSTSTSISAPKPKKPHPKRTSQVSSDEDGDFSDPPSNDEINQRTGDENDDNHHPSSKRNGLISERRNLIKLDLKSPNVEESFKKMMNCTCSETIKKLKNKLPSNQTIPNSIELSAQTITDLPTTTEPTDSNPISLNQDIIDLKKTLGGVRASLGGSSGKVQKQGRCSSPSSIAKKENRSSRVQALELNKQTMQPLSVNHSYTVISSEIEKGPDLESMEGRIVNIDGVELPAPSRAISASASSLSNTITKDNGRGPTNPKGKERAPDQNEATDDSNPLSPNPLSTFDSGSIGSFFSKLTKDSESLTATIQYKIFHLPNPADIPVGLTSSGKFDR
ncbi:hypothetical protein PGT21_033843 [Puccinia graminis f. sp. tritici]|uniref:Uncharacterized protein n=1 Tax=Puccinia graminis f. sp. tritici TaxID=56615 RepID=A0A5B0MQL8_PUCGR|nr:hypothetical protein PGT21_033843 [Puccinia graminis f. sp. tritici]